MARLSPRTHLLHRIAWLAMLLPFLALSLVPSGLMPGRAADGTLTLVLCTADGPREVSVDLGGGAPDQAQTGCPFALMHGPALLPAGAPAAAAPLLVLACGFDRWPATHLHAAACPSPRTARAPPMTA
jgi:hypothetical protein